MTSSTTLLLGECSICGEPIFRHRLPNGRQISCAQVRRIDEALKANNQPAQQRVGPLHVVARADQFASEIGVGRG